MAPRILYVVTEDWYFLSHRLPMARAAKDAGYEVHVATRLKDGKAAIEREGFVAHGLSWSRGSLSPWGSFSAVVELRRLLRRLAPDILHNISLKPVLLGTTASLRISAIAVVNSLTGLGTLFIGEAGVSALARKTVRYALSRLLGRRRSRTVVQNPDGEFYQAPIPFLLADSLQFRITQFVLAHFHIRNQVAIEKERRPHSGAECENQFHTNP